MSYTVHDHKVASEAGSMDRRIPEGINGALKITMLDKKGNVLFTESANITGVKMVENQVF